MIFWDFRILFFLILHCPEYSNEINYKQEKKHFNEWKVINTGPKLKIKSEITVNINCSRQRQNGSNLIFVSTFKGLTCRTLSLIDDGRILPDNCVLYNQIYGSICTFSCARGKQFSGPSSVRCGKGGYWSENMNKVSCEGLYKTNCYFFLLFTLSYVFF